MHRILAEKSVNISELRKNPAKYFIDQPVAVLSNNRPAGIEFSLKNRSIFLSYVKTQLNTLLINRLRFFLIIAPQDIS